jgi:alpha-tubulin suppressor-like RCC1 family protein
MSRCIHGATVRGAAVTLLSAGVALGGISCRGDEPAAPNLPEAIPVLGSPAAATAALPFRQLTTNFFHSCGVTTDNLAYCWGDNGNGQLGDGTTTQRRRPVLVGGGRHFRQISAGSNHTCAVTPGNRAFCWGNNAAGQLGTGTTTPRKNPVAVAGGLLFSRVFAGAVQACGVTLDNRAYCWGSNFEGQLGDGTTTDRLSPVPVSGGHLFGQVSLSGLHTCGVTPGSVLFCWGNNSEGELGDGTRIDRRSPVATHTGSLSIRQVSAGSNYTCALTTTDLAYCWGQNGNGRLGNGTFNQGSLLPVKVRGGLHFRSITTGLSHACALTAANVPYCWGDYFFIGTGATSDQRAPMRVAGGLLLSQVQTRVQHTCGATPGNRAYCWGLNADGQIGDGTTSFRTLPVPVAGP